MCTVTLWLMVMGMPWLVGGMGLFIIVLYYAVILCFS